MKIIPYTYTLTQCVTDSLTGGVPEGELDVVLVHLVRPVRPVEARRGVLLQWREREKRL